MDILKGVIAILPKLLGWCLLKRIRADLYIAYTYDVRTGQHARKILYLAIHNATDKSATVDMLLWEDSSWRRWFRRKPVNCPFVVGNPLVTVPPHESRRRSLVYDHANVLDPRQKYFGVRLTNQRAVWVPTRRWRRAVREFEKDFPDWKQHPIEITPIPLQPYPVSASSP